jgi:hypothetical protein
MIGLYVWLYMHNMLHLQMMHQSDAPKCCLQCPSWQQHG